MHSHGLPIMAVPDSDFAHCLPEARKRIGERNPGDIALLALPLVRQIPIWSSDKDFAVAVIELWTTAVVMESGQG